MGLFQQQVRLLKGLPVNLHLSTFIFQIHQDCTERPGSWSPSLLHCGLGTPLLRKWHRRCCQCSPCVLNWRRRACERLLFLKAVSWGVKGASVQIWARITMGAWLSWSLPNLCPSIRSFLWYHLTVPSSLPPSLTLSLNVSLNVSLSLSLSLSLS